MKKRFVLAMVLCIALCLAFGGAAYASSGGSPGYVTDTVGLLTQTMPTPPRSLPNATAAACM